MVSIMTFRKVANFLRVSPGAVSIKLVALIRQLAHFEDLCIRLYFCFKHKIKKAKLSTEISRRGNLLNKPFITWVYFGTINLHILWLACLHKTMIVLKNILLRHIQCDSPVWTVAIPTRNSTDRRTASTVLLIFSNHLKLPQTHDPSLSPSPLTKLPSSDPFIIFPLCRSLCPTLCAPLRPLRRSIRHCSTAGDCCGTTLPPAQRPPALPTTVQQSLANFTQNFQTALV